MQLYIIRLGTIVYITIIIRKHSSRDGIQRTDAKTKVCYAIYSIPEYTRPSIYRKRKRKKENLYPTESAHWVTLISSVTLHDVEAWKSSGMLIEKTRIKKENKRSEWKITERYGCVVFSWTLSFWHRRRQGGAKACDNKVYQDIL